MKGRASAPKSGAMCSKGYIQSGLSTAGKNSSPMLARDYDSPLDVRVVFMTRTLRVRQSAV